jgi:transposase
VAETARGLGLKENNLWRWRKKFRVGGGDGSPSGQSMEAEVIRLRRQLVRVTEEQDILKKALFVFSHRDE